MTNPVNSVTAVMPQNGVNALSQPFSIQPASDAPVSDGWVSSFMQLFPGITLSEAKEYAKQFQDNMMSMLNSQIQKDLKKSRETARKLKEDLTS